MQSSIYKAALVAVVICVLVVLVAPEVDLPDSTSLRANNGAHILQSSMELAGTLLLVVLMLSFALIDRKNFSNQFNAPTRSSLCTFLC